MRERGYVTLVLTTMIMGLITLIVFSLSFVTLSQFKFTREFRNYQQSLYLSLSAQEEALYQISTGNFSNLEWKALGTGFYSYEINSLDNGKYEIICMGKVKNTIRTFQGLVELPRENIDLHWLKDYAVYSSGDLYIQPLAGLYTDNMIYPCIIGVTGDLYLNANFDDSTKLDVRGDIVLSSINKDKLPSQLQKSTLSAYSAMNGQEYIDWLEDHYPERIKRYEGNRIKGNAYNEAEEVLIFDENHEVIIDGNVEGLLVFKDVRRIVITETARISGGIILIGSNHSLQMDGFIKGNMIILSTEGKYCYNGEIIYCTDTIEKLSPYLSAELANYAVRQGPTVIEWIELK